MKYLILIIVFAYSVCLAQDEVSIKSDNHMAGKDSINIRQVVMQQIASIKNEKVIKNVESHALKSDMITEIESGSVSMNWVQRIFIFTDLSLAVVLFVVWRRKKQKINNEETARLRKSVIRLRNDRVDSRNDVQLSTLRVSLQSRSLGKRFDDENLSVQARQLSISKGELYLASKLKSIVRKKNARASY